MAETLNIVTGTKSEKYQALIPQIESLLMDEDDAIASMANVAAVIWETFGFFWIGFYRVKGEQLILGPFQGPLACMRIKKGRGVCGTAFAKASTIVVPDVDKFPGHIACSSQSRSEIVVPLIKDGEVVAVLDIDSTELSTFDETDALYLGQIASLVAAKF